MFVHAWSSCFIQRGRCGATCQADADPTRPDEFHAFYLLVEPNKTKANKTSLCSSENQTQLTADGLGWEDTSTGMLQVLRDVALGFGLERSAGRGTTGRLGVLRQLVRPSPGSNDSFPFSTITILRYATAQRRIFQRKAGSLLGETEKTCS